MNFFPKCLLLLFWAKLPGAMIFIMKPLLLQIISNLGLIEVSPSICITLILALYWVSTS
jgi:hypothetical protein